MTKDEYLAQGWREKYGVMWAPGILEASIEQRMFLGLDGEHRAKGFLGQKEHFKQFISLIFTHERAVQPWEWNPNTLEIIDAYFEEGNKWTCIAGHGSSAKSRTIAAIMVADFLMDPENTSCLVTSTTLPDGKRRVWADVQRFWYNAGAYFGGEDALPGILTPSTATIRFIDRATGREDEARGLALIPSGNEDAAKDGVSKMIGFKAPRLRLFIDEASHISWKVVQAAESNLETGGQVDKGTGVVNFRVMATLNPNVKSDTGGRLCIPVDANGKEDWKAVDTTTEKKWKNKRGITIRLSGYESPNVKMALEGKCAPHDQPWTGLLSLQTLTEQKERLSAADFQRQYLAIWPETEAIETLFTDQEFKHHGSHQIVQQRAMLVAKIKACDPSWTHGGDRAPLSHMDLVRDENNRLVIEFDKIEWMDADLDPTKDKSIQLEAKLAGRLSALGVQGKDFGIDITGGGRIIDDHVRALWPGSGRVGVIYNAAASEKPISSLDPTPANEKYENLGTEMWMRFKELLISGQVRNMPEWIIEEFCARRYGDNNGRDNKGRITMEETKKMKKRIGKSPDAANSIVIAAYVAFLHYGLVATAKPARSLPQNPSQKSDFDFTRLIPHKQGSFRKMAARYNNLTNGPSDV